MARGVPCSSRVCACLSRGRMRVPCVPCTAARVVRAALLLGRVQRGVAVSGNARRIVRVFTCLRAGCCVPGDVACCLLQESLH